VLRAELWVLHSDRLARGEGAGPGDANHLLEYVFWARRHGVRLRSVEDDSMLDNLLLAAAQGERNAEDSRRKSLAVKAGVHRRWADRGERHGGPLPFGYRLDALAGLTLDRFEASVVHRMFREYVGGKSQLEITRRLRKEGVPTKRGGEWHQGTVRQILANPFYAGQVRLNGEQRAGTHEAIVPEELWRQAQAAMSGHRRGAVAAVAARRVVGISFATAFFDVATAALPCSPAPTVGETAECTTYTDVTAAPLRVSEAAQHLRSSAWTSISPCFGTSET
jgi:hypothetical protein